jgi:hypothetical protein
MSANISKELSTPAGTVPAVEFGLHCINSFNSSMISIRINERTTKGGIREHAKQFCHKVFDKHSAKYLEQKFSFNDVPGFFLNLDNNNQRTFLNYCFQTKIDLTFPSIPNYKVLGEKYGMKDWEMYNQEDVRMLAVGFNEIDEWDAYPHALIWIRKWCLYSINNSITDENWPGERYGNYTNWVTYFTSMTVSQQLELLQGLIFYK